MAIAVRALCPVLVGREPELSALEDALLAARRGQGGVVILGGEAGMGKTRLASELTGRAERIGMPVMSGSCSEAEVALPYLPFLEAIGNYLVGADVAAVSAALGPAAAEVAQLFPQLGTAPSISGDLVNSKLRLFEGLLLLLRHAAGDTGLLLILEDLHWADPATRELLDYLTRRLRATNVLTLATYRREELHRKHALLPTIQAWRRGGGVEMVELEPLDTPGVQRLVSAVFDGEPISDEFAEFLRRRAEGNPFVVEELLKEAVDRGDVFRTATGWDRKELRELRLPESVRDGILLRLERLPEADARMLAVASVVGRAFAADVVAAAAGIDGGETLDALQRCVMHQLVDEDERVPGVYRFRHALTREAIYEDMVSLRRQQMHATVAGLLRDRGAAPADLAHHLLLGRRDAEAVEACRVAAAEASARVAFADAAELLERAAPLVADAGERGRVLFDAADARWNNTETGLARRLAEEAVAAFTAAGMDVESARARILLGRCHWELQRTDLAQAEFDAARAVLEPRGPSQDLALLYVRMAGIATFNYEYERAGDLAARAAAIAEAVGAERILAWAWIFEGGALKLNGTVDQSIELMDRGYRLAVERGFWFQAGNACFNTIWICNNSGEGRLAQEWTRRAAVIPPGAADTWIGYTRAFTLLHQGELREALELNEFALDRAETVGNIKQQWRGRVLQARLLAELGRGAEAAAVLPPISTRVDRQDSVYDGGARVRVALAASDPELARELARGLDTSGSGVPAPNDQAALVLHDDVEAVRALWEQLMPAIREQDRGPQRTLRGMLALAEGRPADARKELAAAVDRFREQGMLLDAWHVSLALARAHAAAGDAAAAAAVLAATTEEAGPAGAALVLRLAGELASELGMELELGAAEAEPSAQAPELTGERFVSVLFADVRGYTAAAAGAAPAELGDRMAALHRWATTAVARHHGVIDKFAGDAVMATFNVSGTSVDHARQAVECARELADKGAAAGIPVGAGVATGPAVVGRLTDGANLSVLGATTNLAARLQAASAGGQVTVSEETLRRLPPALSAGAEPVELDLKGFPAPVSAYRLPT